MKIRDAILGGPGLQDLVVELDYSQLEVFATAILAGCPELVGMLKAGGDLHSETAAKRLGCKPSEVPADVRRKSKPVNFQLAYGGTAKGIAGQAGMPVEEAQGFIDAYYARFPGVKRYQDDLAVQAKAEGVHAGRRDPMGKPVKEFLLQHPHGKAYKFVQETPNWARRPGARRIEANFPTPKLKNYPVQGLASDIMRAAMAEMWRQRCTLFTGTVQVAAQVHDSVVLRLVRPVSWQCLKPLDEQELASLRLIQKIMADFPKLRLRKMGLPWPDGLELKVDCEVGRSWSHIAPFDLSTNQYAT